METRRLGGSDLEISPIGIGAWAMGGGGWAFAWGGQDDADSIAAIRAGVEAGMNWIDTAAVYGLGHSESVVAKAVQGLEPMPLIFTKCGRVSVGGGRIGSSLKRESVRAECEASLKRLGVDRIDLYQMHWPQPDEEIEEGWTAMAELQREGKVRHIGVSNFNVAQLKRAEKIAPVASLQPPYSLLKRDVEQEILPYCLQRGIGVIAYSPMASGLLSGKMTKERVLAFPADDWRSRAASFQEPELSRNLEAAAKLAEIGSRHERSAGEAAIAWVLHNPAVTGAIVGFRNASQAVELNGALRFRLTEDEVRELPTT